MGAVTLDPQNALLLVIDLQDKFTPHIHEHARVVKKCTLLIEAAKALGIPVIVSEQYKKGFGETLPEIKAAAPADAGYFEKMHFGCFGNDCLRDAIAAPGRKQLIICGVEAHVCVFQTVANALNAGYTVLLAEDAIGSRRPSDRETALRRMQQAGAIPATAEMLIMEALVIAGTTQFKTILPLLKEI